MFHLDGPVEMIIHVRASLLEQRRILVDQFCQQAWLFQVGEIDEEIADLPLRTGHLVHISLDNAQVFKFLDNGLIPCAFDTCFQFHSSLRIKEPFVMKRDGFHDQRIKNNKFVGR